MLQPDQPDQPRAKEAHTSKMQGSSTRSSLQSTLILLAVAGSYLWSYFTMVNERVVMFELQTNFVQLQNEVRQHQGHFERIENDAFKLQTSFERMRANFEVLRDGLRENRQSIDTQQLELAQLQTQHQPNSSVFTHVPKYKEPSVYKKTAASSYPRPAQRQLSQHMSEDRALIRVDAPEGFSQIIMGAESGADNVIMEKQHFSDGGDFMLSRNQTQALGIDVDGGVTVHSDPLSVASTLQAISGNKLTMRSTETIHMQTVKTHTLSEIDGQEGRWSSAALKINVGDTVVWTWTNYHNLIETDEAGVIKSGGQTSGALALGSSFELAFSVPGSYHFKSQTASTMACMITVVDAFKFEEGSLTLQSLTTQSLTVVQDVEVNGRILPRGFAAAHEIKLFLGSECPPGWAEATELGGYMLMGRPEGGEVNATMNRPMSSTEEGRTHGIYFKGGAQFQRRSTWDSAPEGSGIQFRTTWGNDFYYDKFSNPAYQNNDYMQHIGEYYPFVSVLICKAA